MRKLLSSHVVLLMLAAVVAVGFVDGSAAYAAEGLVFEGVWARAASEGHTSAAYMHIANTGSGDVIIVAAAADVADRVEIHETTMEVTMEDGRLSQIMRMEEIEQLVVPAGGAVELKPGGLHVMFIGLTRELVEGETFALTFYTQDGGAIEVDVTVTVLGLDDDDHHHHHDH